jgi:hypothetical protein
MITKIRKEQHEFFQWSGHLATGATVFFNVTRVKSNTYLHESKHVYTTGRVVGKQHSHSSGNQINRTYSSADIICKTASDGKN